MTNFGNYFSPRSRNAI